jgi:predicted DCC family thiol-disulfide oxidoreductase YuxK
MQQILRTNAPGKYVLLYDGHCPFCTRQANRLTKIAKPGVVMAADFQSPGVLDEFPGIGHGACMQALHLVTPDGRVFRGVEAIVRALTSRSILGSIAYLYYVPGVRQLCDRLYRFVASRRYWFWGKKAQGCETGTCAVHFQKPRPPDN